MFSKSFMIMMAEVKIYTSCLHAWTIQDSICSYAYCFYGCIYYHAVSQYDKFKAWITKQQLILSTSYIYCITMLISEQIILVLHDLFKVGLFVA